MIIKSALEQIKAHEPLWDKWVMTGETVQDEPDTMTFIVRDSTGSEPVERMVKCLYAKDETIRDALCQKTALARQNPYRFLVDYLDYTNIPIFEEGELKGFFCLILTKRLQLLEEFLKQNPVKRQVIFQSVAVSIGSGLNHIHECGMIHGAVEPQNILVDTESQQSVFLLDPVGFIQGTRSAVWTPPEVRRNHIYSCQSDIYTYGVFLYYLLNNGEMPPIDYTVPEFPEPPCDDDFTKKVVCKCTKVDPEARYKSMNQVLHALVDKTEVSDNTYDNPEETQSTVNVQTSLAPVKSLFQKHRWLKWATVGVAVLIIGGIALGTVITTQQQKRKEEAKTNAAVFQSGVEAMDKEDYLAAVKAFRKVSEGDEKYSQAQQNEQKAINAYVRSVIEKADKYQTDNQHIEAIHMLDEAMEVLPENQELSDRKTECVNGLKKYTVEVVAKSDALSKDGKNYEALENIRKVPYRLEADKLSNSVLSKAMTRYFPVYRQELSEKVKTFDNSSQETCNEMRLEMENAKYYFCNKESGIAKENEYPQLDKEYNAMKEMMNKRFPIELTKDFMTSYMKKSYKMEYYKMDSSIVDCENHIYSTSDHTIYAVGGHTFYDNGTVSGVFPIKGDTAYSRFAGTIVLGPESSRGTITFGLTNDTVTIEKVATEIEYRTNSGTASIPFDVDLENYKYLIIKRIDTSGTTFPTYVYFVDAFLYQ